MDGGPGRDETVGEWCKAEPELVLPEISCSPSLQQQIVNCLQHVGGMYSCLKIWNQIAIPVSVTV